MHVELSECGYIIAIPTPVKHQLQLGTDENDDSSTRRRSGKGTPVYLVYRVTPQLTLTRLNVLRFNTLGGLSQRTPQKKKNTSERGCLTSLSAGLAGPGAINPHPLSFYSSPYL